MALPAGKSAFAAAMVQADKDFVTEYGGTLDPNAEARMLVKYEKMYDIIVTAITQNAEVVSNGNVIGGIA